MARVENEIVVIKDVPVLICDTCGEVEYTLEVSREIDVIMKEFFAGRLLAKPLAAGEIAFKPQRAGLQDGMELGLKGNDSGKERDAGDITCFNYILNMQLFFLILNWPKSRVNFPCRYRSPFRSAESKFLL
ncbi:MAG: type II toxin-antitoxin system MqsA family antitoxin [Methanothrix sp.]|nr:type II toxin-antitoxin system MqsA family antitoxin [Methanothrix sp.]